MSWIRNTGFAEAEPELVKSRNRNSNLSEVRTGTVKSSYDSATLFLPLLCISKKREQIAFLVVWRAVKAVQGALKARN